MQKLASQKFKHQVRTMTQRRSYIEARLAHAFYLFLNLKFLKQKLLIFFANPDNFFCFLNKHSSALFEIFTEWRVQNLDLCYTN